MEAPRDKNFIPALLGTSDVDGKTLVPLYADPITHRLKVDIDGSYDAEGNPFGDSVETDNTSTFSGTIIDWNEGNFQSAILSQNIAYYFTNPPVNGQFQLKIKSAGHSVSWPGTVKWSGGSAPVLSASTIDILTFYFDGTNYFGTAQLNF